MNYDVTIARLIRDAWNNGTFDRIRELYISNNVNVKPTIPSIYDIENSFKALLWKAIDNKTACDSCIRVDLIENGEIHEFKVSFEINLISGSNNKLYIDKPIKIVDARNNNYDVVSITNDETNTIIKIKNILSNVCTGKTLNKNYFNDFGLDEYPLTDQWANSVTKHKKKHMDCGND